MITKTEIVILSEEHQQVNNSSRSVTDYTRPSHGRPVARRSWSLASPSPEPRPI